MMEPNPLAPTVFEGLVSFGIPLALICILLYSILRFAVWAPRGGSPLEHIRKHALWTGIIAWAFSSLASAGSAGILTYGQIHDRAHPWSEIPWTQLLTPVVAVIAVHAIGQASWPAPKASKRTAILEFRRVRDYVPPALGWTALGSFVLTAAIIPFVAATEGFDAVSAPPPGARTLWTMGKVDGWVMAVALAVSLILLAAGTLFVMRLIARRRSLEDLSAEQNRTLRTIGMNRLLRVSTTVATGFSAIAGNYLLQPAPGSDTMSFTNWLGLFNMAVLVTMFFWKPPALGQATPLVADEDSTGERPNKATFAATKLLDSTVVLLVPAALAGLLCGYAVRHWLGWMGSISIALTFMLLAYLAVEIMLVRNYGASRWSLRGERASLSRALPAYIYVGLSLSATGLAAAIFYAVRSKTSLAPRRWDGFPTPWAVYVVPTVLAFTILLVGLAVMWFIRSRPQLRSVSAALDNTLRRRSLFRAARTLTSSWFALAGLVLSMAERPLVSYPPTPQIDLSTMAALCFALAGIVLFLPVRSYTAADVSPAASNTPTLSK